MEGSAVLARPAAARQRKAGARPVFVQRYWAFLSYSHADSKSADWLHGVLERFRVPAEVVGRRTDQFIVPASLAPIFRDRHELAASSDLSGEIREAIDCSRHLLVLCSPAAAASRWVNEEIRAFKRLRPDGKVLAAIVDGEPHAADPARECLPAALTERYDGRGRLAGHDAEPIAADLRPTADGRDKGLLKLVAGMLDLRLDELVQREERRRHRRWMLVSAGAITGMTLATGLAVFAVQARDEARDQRRQAESLVGFMIGDLKDKLEPVGRLDALGAVGTRVLAYYERQDKASLSDEALAQRSRALTLMGDIAQRRGDFDGALRLYREGLASTTEALRRDPANPQRLFDQAQNVFWIGWIASLRGEYAAAVTQFTDYRALAERMIAVDPANPKWRLEGIYADSNLGVVALQTRHFTDSAQRFARALGALDALRRKAPSETAYSHLDIENRGYLADALERSGQLPAALDQRGRQLGTLRQLLARQPDDAQLLAQQVVAMWSLAREQGSVGRRDEALASIAGALAVADLLVRREPKNREWADRAAGARLEQARLLIGAGRVAEAAAATERGCAESAHADRAARVVTWRRLSRQCLQDRIRLNLATGAKAQAMLTAGQLLAEVQNDRTGDVAEDGYAYGEAQLLTGDVAAAMGDRAAATTAWRQALARWPLGVEQRPMDLANRRALLARLGQTAPAGALTARLQAMGWRD